ncbi:MAG: sigma-70 family RNA polymerase sigma factor [Rivularia sp. (in: cyanobacteria)]|jgi:RNA polymerase sigma factor (sigma-70 family)
MFSTFAELEEDRFSKWLTDIRLHRNMQNCLDSLPKAVKEENYWALYWYKNLQCMKPEYRRISASNSLPRMHIQAYLQEPCYRASQKIVNFFTKSKYSVADYFQIANAEVEAILLDFNPSKSSGLKAYFTMAIKSRLRDILRQRKEADICTNWALLRKVSKKLFVESLENAGLSAKQVSQYRLAWTCFKQLYVQTQPGATASLPQPTAQLWEAIANLYNDNREQLTELTPLCTAPTIEKWLNQAIVYLRAYMFPQIKSLNTFKPDTDTNETLDLPDLSSESLIADIITVEELQERENQISQMLSVLVRAFQTLDMKSQEVLRLYYQQEFTQQKIVQQMQISQPTVSRKLVKGREFLLETLVEWSQDLNISVKPHQIKDMSIALEEWLRNNLVNIDLNL